MHTVLNNITVQFGDYTALKDITLEIKEGEFVAILGPSGCGKTTLLRLLAGFLKPTSGEIHISGEKVADDQFVLPPNKRNIGMVFQSYALWPHMTVKKNIAFPIAHGNQTAATRKKNKEQVVQSLVKMVGLEGLENRYANELSGGQRQRVAIARGLAADPQILLMDEPLSNLDAELKIEMRREIKRIHKETHKTIVYVTHDQSEALAMADRIVVLNKGVLQQFDTPKAIYYQPTTPFVAKFVGRTNLIEGQWKDADTFIPKGCSIPWVGVEVPPAFVAHGYFPIKPDRLSITKHLLTDALQGEIQQIEYQGQHDKVLVATSAGIVEVCYSGTEVMSVGDLVRVCYG